MKVHIEFVLDKSGSMFSRKTDTVGGTNSFIKEQKKVPGEATMSMSTFSGPGSVTTIFENKNLQDVEPIKEEDYVPGGNTALFDATAERIAALGAYLNSLNDKDKPEKVIFVIMTDGQENASRETTRVALMNMIIEQETKWNWEFHYIGSSKEDMQAAHAIGIKAATTQSFKPSDSEAVRYAGMSRAVAFSRQG